MEFGSDKVWNCLKIFSTRYNWNFLRIFSRRCNWKLARTIFGISLELFRGDAFGIWLGQYLEFL